MLAILHFLFGYHGVYSELHLENKSEKQLKKTANYQIELEKMEILKNI